MSPSSVTQSQRQRARHLRASMTPPEKLLWRELKRQPNCHFRRQVPLDRYVVDFACLSGKLIVELDGHSHDGEGMQERDRGRDAYFRDRGFTVLRLSNADVLRDVESAIATIMREVDVNE